MSKVIFRNIEKKDLDQVFVLLNQLKQIEIDTIDKDKAWSDFINNTSSNSVVGLYNNKICLLYTSPSPRDKTVSRMPSSA